MKMIQRLNAPAVVTMLPPEEWRFSDCPNDQQHWCDIYEYARENEEVRAMAMALRKGVWDDPGLFPDRCSNLLGKKFFEAFPAFPETPFLALPPAERQAACAELADVRKGLALRAHHPAGHYSNSAKTWSLELHKNTPRHVAIAELDRILQDPRGGQLPLDRLRYLAVQRLYKHLKRAKKVLNFLQDQRAPVPGKNESAVSNARKSAKQLTKEVLNRIL